MPFPISTAEIAKTEEKTGYTFPLGVKARLLPDNGGEIAMAHDHWRLIPFLDSSDRKRIARTCNDIVRETASMREWDGFPAEGFVVASTGGGDYLIILPETEGSKALGDTIYLWDHETREHQPVADSLDGHDTRTKAANEATRPTRSRDESRAPLDATLTPVCDCRLWVWRHILDARSKRLMRILLIAVVVSFALGSGVRADVLEIAMKGRPIVTLSNPGDIDYLRTHVVYVFDMAAHHCQEDSDSKWKPNQQEIRDMINRVKRDSHLELEFTVPTPITVEERIFAMKRLWVSIRDRDWATFDWAFETSEGQLVALSGIEGTYNRKLGPMIRGLAREPGE